MQEYPWTRFSSSHSARFRTSNLIRQILSVVDVPPEADADMMFGHRDHRAQETVRVRKEVEMRIERVEPLALHRHHDDEPLRRDPAQFGQRLAIVEDVLDDMGADHRVEFPV